MGTVLLWASRIRDYEVQSRVSGNINCGVAVRDGCDLVVLDQCSGKFVLRSDFVGTNLRVDKLNEGTSYLVRPPYSSLKG